VSAGYGRAEQVSGHTRPHPASGLLDQLGHAAGSTIDLVAGLGYPLPITVEPARFPSPLMNGITGLSVILG